MFTRGKGAPLFMNATGFVATTLCTYTSSAYDVLQSSTTFIALEQREERDGAGRSGECTFSLPESRQLIYRGGCQHSTIPWHPWCVFVCEPLTYGKYDLYSAQQLAHPEQLSTHTYIYIYIYADPTSNNFPKQFPTGSKSWSLKRSTKEQGFDAKVPHFRWCAQKKPEPSPHTTWKASVPPISYSE